MLTHHKPANGQDSQTSAHYKMVVSSEKQQDPLALRMMNAQTPHEMSSAQAALLLRLPARSSEKKGSFHWTLASEMTYHDTTE